MAVDHVCPGCGERVTWDAVVDQWKAPRLSTYYCPPGIRSGVLHQAITLPPILPVELTPRERIRRLEAWLCTEDNLPVAEIPF